MLLEVWTGSRDGGDAAFAFVTEALERQVEDPRRGLGSPAVCQYKRRLTVRFSWVQEAAESPLSPVKHPSFSPARSPAPPLSQLNRYGNDSSCANRFTPYRSLG